MRMTDELKKEFTRKITQANSTELVVILYDMILVYIKEAGIFWEKSDKEEYIRSLQKIRNCIGELMDSLNLEYEIARNMYSLYVFFVKELVKAQTKENGLTYLESIRPMIESLRGAYDQIACENKNGPIMKNTQTVYAGLTYGKKDVNVNLEQLSNRGFRV